MVDGPKSSRGSRLAAKVSVPKVPRSALVITIILLAFAVLELVGQWVVRARVVPPEDWQQAAAHVEAQLGPKDLIVSAPDWTDPLLRNVLGEHISLSDAGRSDLSAYERLWVLSVRGALPPEAPEGEPNEEESFGAIRVQRWDLGPTTVLFDFLSNAGGARVSVKDNGASRPCQRQPAGMARGGGLGAGAMTPGDRFVCPGPPWLWMGPTVTEDLDLRPRRCLWQHPPGIEPMVATFRDVPLGERLVLYGGLYYEHERKLEGGPIDVAIHIDGEAVGQMQHRDGDGWKRMEVSTPGEPGATGTVSIAVSAPRPHLRTFCWTATTRSGSRPVDRPAEESP